MKLNSILLLGGLFIAVFIGCSNEPTEVSMPTTKYSHAKKDVKGRHLATVEQVKEWIDHNHPISIFEVSKQEKYNSGHLPNALHIWRPDYENSADYPYGGMIATQQEMEELLSKNGVLPNSKIVLYDTKGCVDAMRFRWILTLYGYDNIAVMNGGKTAWKKAGYSLVKTPYSAKQVTNFSFPKVKKLPKVATLEDVQRAIQDTNIIILDTREPEEYHGQPYVSKGKLYTHKKGAFTHGCIPTAIHLNWSDAVDLHGDHCFKSLKDLHYNLQKAGILPHKEIITYCQSGVRSAHTTYVLTELLNYPNVTNYDGSWIEWSYYHEKNPESVKIEQHTPPDKYNRLFSDLQQQLN